MIDSLRGAGPARATPPSGGRREPGVTPAEGVHAFRRDDRSRRQAREDGQDPADEDSSRPDEGDGDGRSSMDPSGLRDGIAGGRLAQLIGEAAAMAPARGYAPEGDPRHGPSFASKDPWAERERSRAAIAYAWGLRTVAAEAHVLRPGAVFSGEF